MKNEITNKELERTRGLLLAYHGITLTQVANKFEVSRQFVHQVIRGTHSSDRSENIRKYISEMIQAGESHER